MTSFSVSFLAALLVEAFVKHNLSYFDLSSVPTEQMNGDRLSVLRCFYWNKNRFCDVDSLHGSLSLSDWGLESTIMIADYSTDYAIDGLSKSDDEINHDLSILAFLLTYLGINEKFYDLKEENHWNVVFGLSEHYGKSRLEEITLDILDSDSLSDLLEKIKEKDVCGDDAFLYGALSANKFIEDWAKILEEKVLIDDMTFKLCEIVTYNYQHDETEYEYLFDEDEDCEDFDMEEDEEMEEDEMVDEQPRKLKQPIPIEELLKGNDRRPYTTDIVKEIPGYGIMQGTPILYVPVIEWRYVFEKDSKLFQCILKGDLDGPKELPMY